MSTIQPAFRNYQFQEQDGHLYRIKRKREASQRYDHYVQFYPCAVLVKEYQSHLLQKISDFRAFSPTFSSPFFLEIFENWRCTKIKILEEKIGDPLRALQMKVAKRVEQLFQFKGERSLLLGCFHLQNSSLCQTQTNLFGALPLTTDVNQESHLHEHSVCIDWRSDPKGSMGLDFDDFEIVWVSKSERFEWSPDFIQRKFEEPSFFEDFKFVRGVRKIHAERVPFFETGPFVHETNSCFSVVKMIFEALAPGGTFSFDLGVVIPLRFRFKGERKDFEAFWQEEVLETSKNFDQILEIKKKEVALDPEYNSAIEHELKSCSSKKERRLYKDHLIELAANKKAEDEVLHPFYQQESEKAKHFTLKHREKVLLKPDQIVIEWTCVNQPLLTFTLSDIQNGFGKFLFERCSSGKRANFDHGLKVFIDQSDIGFDHLFALYRQLECYGALHVNPALAEELLPENKILLDEMLKFWALLIGQQLSFVGFENPILDLDITHPENGRQFSRIVRVQKPGGV